MSNAQDTGKGLGGTSEHPGLRVASLLLLGVLGFGSKSYSGPLQGWVRSYAGGVVYEVFWILLVTGLGTGSSPGKVALWVLGLTSALEALQLWHPALLEPLRATFIGHALIGSSFSWWDFPHYGAGSLAGWFWANRIMGTRPRRPRSAGASRPG